MIFFPAYVRKGKDDFPFQQDVRAKGISNLLRDFVRMIRGNGQAITLVLQYSTRD